MDGRWWLIPSWRAIEFGWRGRVGWDRFVIGWVGQFRTGEQWQYRGLVHRRAWAIWPIGIVWLKFRPI